MGVGPQPPTHHSLPAVAAAGRLASPRPSLVQVVRSSEAELLLEAAGPERQNRGLASGPRSPVTYGDAGFNWGCLHVPFGSQQDSETAWGGPLGVLGQQRRPLRALASDAVQPLGLRSVLGQPSSSAHPRSSFASGRPGSVRAPQLFTEFFARTKRSNGPGKHPAVQCWAIERNLFSFRRNCLSRWDRGARPPAEPACPCPSEPRALSLVFSRGPNRRPCGISSRLSGHCLSAPVMGLCRPFPAF